MTKTTTILAVDDDDDILDIYRLHAQDQKCKTLVASNAIDALGILEQVTVDLIISDVVMPEMDGYEFCRQVKENPKTEKIPFIFVSAKTELEELTKGYELGADDYIPKPIIYEQLILKINRLLEVNSQNGELREQLDNYYKTAMQAMNYSSELGKILEFYKACVSANSYKELANYLFMTTKALELKCSFQVYDLNGNIIGFSDRGTIQPLEIEIMSLAKAQARFYDFGKRTIVSYNSFSLLIKNMPQDDDEKYGRLKDILGTLCDAISSRVEVLLTNSAAEQKHKVVETVSSAMIDIDSSFRVLQKENISAIEDMLEDLEDALLTLGLTDFQEENIRKIAENCLLNTNKAFYKGVKINSKLEELREHLSMILE